MSGGILDNVISLQQLFHQRVFRVPDYQRGYSWERRHVQDFLDDLDLLRPNKYHYTGTVVLHVDKSQSQQWDEEGHAYWSADIVDGQQRLTTILMVLDGIRRYLSGCSESSVALATGIRKTFLATIGMHQQPLFKLSLNKDANFFWQNSILADHPVVEGPKISSERRLTAAKEYIAEYLHSKEEQWLRELYSKVAAQLRFSLYEVETEADVGVIFEVMNNRGKTLTDLEKVKNYLLHVSTVLDAPNPLAKSVNEAWSNILTQLMAADLLSSDDEDRLLRTHWFCHFDSQSRNWQGSNTIKSKFDLKVIKDDDGELLGQLIDYTDGLRDSAFSFCDAYSPARDAAFASIADVKLRKDIRNWSFKLLRIGVVATFVPLLVAARSRWMENPNRYLELIRLCERFAFRVYRLKGLRANAGQATLFRLGYQITHNDITFEQTMQRIKDELGRLCNDEDFENLLNAQHQQTRNAYDWIGLRYFLYEYEEHLCSLVNASPKVTWQELVSRDRRETIEHILPQSIEDKPEWRGDFDAGMHQRCVHNLGNLTLTLGNSTLSNNEFIDKQGKPGQERYCYANSVLRVESELMGITSWKEAAIADRGQKLLEWARMRWAVQIDSSTSNGGSPTQWEINVEDDTHVDEDPVVTKDRDTEEWEASSESEMVGTQP